jgi:hypothetical protein
MSKNKIPYTAPYAGADGYNCPYCHAYANQSWGKILQFVGTSNMGPIEEATLGTCYKCKNFTIWFDNKMIWPVESTAPYPNPDLPEDIMQDFEEARSISKLSPRGAAALLRLAIQKLCKHLGEDGKNINDNISSLVEKGLPVKIQQALDIVRVIGNNAVHPGQIDLSDNIEIVNTLFELVNITVEVMITQPKNVEEIYTSVIPDSQRAAIEKRDKIL